MSSGDNHARVASPTRMATPGDALPEGDALLYSEAGDDMRNVDADANDADSISSSTIEDEQDEGRSNERSAFIQWLKSAYQGHIQKRMIERQITPALIKTVTKCILAYLIASLFTFVPAISHRMAALLPHHDPDDKVTISNLHFIATVSVYFHPGRSVGSMVEANIFALFAFLYAIGLSLTSMVMAVFLHDRQFPLTSNAVVVVIFLGIGTALVGYAKVHVGRPTFNTACSLAGVIIFTVIVKEGSSHLGHYSFDKVWQVTLVVVTGVLVSNVVCFLLWPKSACTSLQYDIQRNLRSFSTLLKVLTKTFLLDDMEEFGTRSKRIKQAFDNHHASFVSLKNNLEEAKLEAPFDERMRGRVSSYIGVVDSLNILAQHLGGLRTSCTLEHDIIEAIRSREASRANTIRIKDKRSGSSSVRIDEDMFDVATANTQSTRRSNANSSSAFSTPQKNKIDKRSAFEHYLETLGPHVRDLVSACGHTLKGLTTAFEATVNGIDSSEGYKKNVQSEETFEQLTRSVRSALSHFRHERTVAIKRSYSVYARGTIDTDDLASSLKGLKSDEDVFVIFYFVFLLEEFALELEKLVDALEVIRRDEKRIQEERLQPWTKRCVKQFTFPLPRVDRWGRSFREHSFSRTLFDLFVRRKHNVVVLPSSRAHQPNTRQTPAPLTRRERLNRIIWQIGEFFKQSETKFAIKTGLGCAALASPAFIPSARHTFTQYQGQWALISFMVVISPTVGQSNQMSVHRILGTIAGAAMAVAGYWLFPDNNVALPIFGALFALPCFYYIIKKPHLATTGRFVLLTNNLTALYAYNLRKVGLEVEQIAYRRTIDVVVGVLWATLLNHLVWPIEARRELTRGLSDLLFKLSFLYQKLVLAYSSVDVVKQTVPDEDTERQSLLTRHDSSAGISEIQSIELALQVHLIKLEGFLMQTKHEPRLKGPFPVAQYKHLLDCCQHMLDLLHTMNLVTLRPDWHTQVRQDFILPVDATGQRRDLVGTVGLFFWLLASAFSLKTPLPPYLPAAEEARQAVLHTIRQLPVVKRRAIRGSSEYLLYFAYALSMKDLIRQLEEVGSVAQNLFGVMGGSAVQWEAQFEPSAEEYSRLEATQAVAAAAAAHSDDDSSVSNTFS